MKENQLFEVVGDVVRHLGCARVCRDEHLTRLIQAADAPGLRAAVEKRLRAPHFIRLVLCHRDWVSELQWSYIDRVFQEAVDTSPDRHPSDPRVANAGFSSKMNDYEK